ncbi:MAG: phospholipase D-like domain-containing protein, partial [Lysobacterales bacterium]
MSAQQQVTLSCTPPRPHHCAIPSPLLSLGKADVNGSRHHVTLVENGEDALALRVHLIRAARRSIEMQNFILRKDDTGELVLNELLGAARRGVRVRLLLDQMFSLSDARYLVLLSMAHANFEVRFYNPSFYKARMAKHDWVSGIACCFRRVNQRMHNKLLAVDDVVGLIGGRNVADRYFDFDTSYDFKDRDVLVYGATAVDMRESFDGFWESPETVPVQHLRDVARELLENEPREPPPFAPVSRLQPVLEAAEDPDVLRALFVDSAFEVERLAYFSDRPRKQAPDGEGVEDITPELYNVLDSARRSVVIQSPYMVLSKRAREMFRALRKRNPS